MNELVFTTASELALAIRARRISAVEVVDAHLAQIARHNAALNAIVTLNEEDARRRARAADAALAKGELWGPLHGVPYTLKDHFDTAGLRSTMGYRPFVERVAEKDHVIAARMKAAGGVLLGKTNCALYDDNPFGSTNNPWNLAYSPGVSSSGSVAAIAAGLSPLDIGSDVGGSIIEPSHYAGVYGMRPTERRVPVGDLPTDRYRVWQHMMVMGPLARSVADLHLALGVIAGPDHFETIVPRLPWRAMPRVALYDLRIAWTATLPVVTVADEIQRAIETVAQTLAQQGAWVEPRRPAVDLEAQTAMVGRYIDTAVSAFGEQPASVRDYFEVLEARDAFIAVWEAFLDEWDVFICPAARTTAFSHSAEAERDGEPVNPSQFSPTTGLPAVVIPVAMDQNGLPIGVQLIGRRWDDERLLAIAERIDQVINGYRRPPGY